MTSDVRLLQLVRFRVACSASILLRFVREQILSNHQIRGRPLRLFPSILAVIISI